MNGEYLWNTGNSLAEMRLLAEGAVQLYENDAAPLNRLAIDSGNLRAADAFNTIGTALYSLLVHIREMQAAHIAEVHRQTAAKL